MQLRPASFCVSILLLALSIIGCSDLPDPQVEFAEMDAEATEFGEYGMEPPQTAEPPPPPDAEAPLVPRKLIKTGNLTIEVADVDAVARRVQTLVDSFGGYVSREVSSDYGIAERQLTLKLPAARLDAAVPRLEALAAQVRSRSIQVVDRTTEYVDAAARLSTQRALAKRLRQLVARANAVKDVIEVERELARVTADIESFEARLKSIDRDAAYATLELVIVGESETAVAAGFWQELGESLGFGVDFLRAIILGAVAVWPLWIVVGAVVWWWRRRRAFGGLPPARAD